MADHAATVIESLQIVNVLAQEQDGLFTLQIPVQFPDGIRMQELSSRATAERRQPRQKKGVVSSFFSTWMLSANSRQTWGSGKGRFTAP